MCEVFMKKKVISIAVLAVLLTVLVGYSVYDLVNKTKSSEPENSFFEKADVDMNNLETSDKEGSIEEVEPSADNTTEDVKNSEVTFVYDYTQSLEDYLNLAEGSSKVSIDGSGTPWTSGVSEDSKYYQSLKEAEESGLEVKGTASETQKFWYQLAQTENYPWKVKPIFSDGFAVIPSLKYDLWVKQVAGSQAFVSAPDETEVVIKECDTREDSLISLRNDALSSLTLDYYGLLVEPGSIPYGTKYTLGTGLDDLDLAYHEQGTKDITISDNNNQIYVDDVLETLYCKGYYIEGYHYANGVYLAYYIADRDGRLFFVKARSNYNNNLRDIVAATIDRCVTTY